MNNLDELIIFINSFFKKNNCKNKSVRKRHKIENSMVNVIKNYIVDNFSNVYVWTDEIEKQFYINTTNEINRCNNNLERKFSHNILVRIIDKGNAEKLWSLPALSSEVIVKRDLPLILANDVATLHRFKAHYEYFIQSLYTTDNELQKLTSHERNKYLYAQIILSAINIGGLLYKKAIIQLLPNINCYKYSDNHSWINFSFSKNKKDHESPHFRWLVDPITEMLIHKLARLNNNEIPNLSSEIVSSKVNSILKDFFPKKLFDRIETKGELINSFAQAASARFCVYVPNYVLALMMGQLKNTPLNERRWLNYLGYPQSNLYKQNIKKSKSLKIKSEYSVSFTNNLTRNHQQKIVSVFNNKLLNSNGKPVSAEKAIQFANETIAENLSNLTPTTFYLLSWFISMLQSKKVGTSSIIQYLSLTKSLIDIFGVINITDCEYSIIEDAYSDFIELALSKGAGNAGRYKQISGRLKSFHEFLELNYNVPPVDFNDFFDDGELEESQADANYVKESDYQAIINNLSNKGDLLDCITCIICIFGYRLGLRRNEAHKLTLKELQLIEKDLSYFFVLIRPNSYRNTKSTHSIRQLPVENLLPPNELHLLKNKLSYVLTHLDKSSSSNKTVIFYKSLNTNILCDVSVFDYITTLFKEQTLDENFRFHHLRKSFANNLLFSLSEITPTFTGDPELQKMLYFVCLLMGHSDPKVTLTSYIHLVEENTYKYVKPSIEIQHPKILEYDLISALSNIKKDTLVKAKNRNKKIEIYEHALKSTRLKLKSHKVTAIKKPIKQDINPEINKTNKKWPAPANIIKIITQDLSPSIQDMLLDNSVVGADDTYIFDKLCISNWFYKFFDDKENIRMPIHRNELNSLINYYEKIQVLYISNKRFTKNLIELYIKNCRKRSGEFASSDPEVLKKWYQFINKELSVKKNHIIIKLESSLANKSPSSQQQAIAWSKFLKVTKKQIQLINKTKEEGFAHDKTLYGKLQIIVGSQFTDKKGKTKYKASDGFKMAMFLTYIIIKTLGQRE